MTFKFECPNCGQRISAENCDANTKAACPTCGFQLVVPDGARTIPTGRADLRPPFRGSKPLRILGWTGAAVTLLAVILFAHFSWTRKAIPKEPSTKDVTTNPPRQDSNTQPTKKREWQPASNAQIEAEERENERLLELAREYRLLPGASKTWSSNEKERALLDMRGLLAASHSLLPDAHSDVAALDGLFSLIEGLRNEPLKSARDIATTVWLARPYTKLPPKEFAQQFSNGYRITKGSGAMSTRMAAESTVKSMKDAAIISELSRGR